MWVYSILEAFHFFGFCFLILILLIILTKGAYGERRRDSD